MNWTFKTLLRNLKSSTAGSMAVWGALLTPVLVTGAAISIDVSRIYNMDHDLQAAADALARAGAAELDQAPDSLTRANRAIQNLVRNDQRFGEQGSGQVTVNITRYLKDVPVNDHDPITSDMVTTNAAEAQYVEVQVTPVKVDALFLGEAARNFTKAELEARAVAGRSQQICGAAPIFVCNPYEGTNTSLHLAMGTRNFQRRLVKFKVPGGNKSQYGPGNYGFLDINRCGAKGLKEAIAADPADLCLASNTGVITKPGNVSSVSQALNTRFDIYEGSFKNQKNNALYSPALNVTKGYSYSGNACKAKPDPLAMGLPKDNCFLTDTCPMMDGRMGDGVWDFVSYVAVNHSMASQLYINGTTYTFNYVTHTVTPVDIPSRYEVYRWEIDTNCIPGALTYGTALTPEEGKPQCNTTGPVNPTIDRRVIHVAVLNCNAIEQAGGIKGKSGPHPVEVFVKVFLTNPMGKGKDNIIWGEITGPVISGEDRQASEQVTVVR